MASTRDGSRRVDWVVAAALILASIVVYNANLRVVSTGDSMGSRYVPIALWGWGTTSIDPVAFLARDGHGDPYWISEGSSGEWVSTYPIVTPLLVAPLYAPAAAYLHSVEWRDEAVRGVAKLMEKLAASVVAAFSTGLLFLALRRRVDRAPALALAVAYGFGTSTWMVSSQALWQHGPAQLFVVIGLLLAGGPSSTRAASLAGLVVVSGLLVANRLPDLPLALGFGLFVFASAEAQTRWLLVGGAAVLAMGLLGYNLAVYDSIFGGYSRLGVGPALFDRPLVTGLFAMTMSPGRGLLAYSPFFAFLVLRIRRTSEVDRFAMLDTCLAIGVVLQLLLYASTSTWRSPFVYGPRMLVGALPILVWLLAPVVARLRGAGRAVFGVGVAVSILVQLIGAFHFPSHFRRFASDIWYPHLYPPYMQLKAGAPPMDLPGVTRDLWEWEPFEIALHASTLVEGDRAVVTVDMKSARQFPVHWAVEVVLTALEERPVGGTPALHGQWLARLPALERPATLRFEIDLVDKSARVEIDGEPPEARDVLVGVTPGPASADGFYAVDIGLRRADLPEYRPSYALFGFRREGETFTGYRLGPVDRPHVTLRAAR